MPATAPTPEPASRTATEGAPAWSVRLLGAVEASRPGRTLNRWPTRAVAGLLARLAMQPDRLHPREELIELLWPGVDLVVGRNRLRQTLSSLRSQLEQRADAQLPVLQADRLGLRVRPGALDCDALRFEQLLRLGDAAGARSIYRGELMPGHYEDWVLGERRRLADLHERLDPVLPSLAPDCGDQVPAPPPSGLPNYWTRSFGTELSGSRLLGLVAAQRLVSVHGPGGSGKTRLAVQVAQACCDGKAWSPVGHTGEPLFQRVAFVPLLGRLNAAQALDAISSALRLGAEGNPQQRIVAALAGRRTLLVLDNAEQMVADTGSVVTSLLAAAPTLHVLVTSRLLLEVDGEHAFQLEGLPLPNLKDTPTNRSAAPDNEDAANPAVALFVDRARAARSDFRLEAQNAVAVAALVRLLGGMPLAIELAASRARTLSAHELLARLSESAGSPMLDLLARGTERATEGARHASMRHVVAWSWKQLQPDQAALLRAMTVFAASASPEGVAAAAGMPTRRALLLLDSLRDASLLRAVTGSDNSTRYVLLQPVREYAAEQAAASELTEARARMRDWLLKLAKAAMPRGPAAVAPEIAHVHAALVSAPGDGADASRMAVQLALALRTYWDSDELPASDQLALEQALEHEPDTGLRVDTLDLLAHARAAAGFTALANAHAAAAVALADDERRRSLALTRWVSIRYIGGHLDEAELQAAMDEAGELAARCGDDLARAMHLRTQGLIASNLRLDYAGAERLAAQSLPLWLRLGHRSMALAARLNCATMVAWQGHNEQAEPALAECVRVAQAEGDWVNVLHASRQHGRVLTRLKRWGAATAALRRAVGVGWQRNFTRGLANALLNLPQPLALAGHPEAAARLLSFAQAHWQHLYGTVNRIETRELRLAQRLLRQRLGRPRTEALGIEGLGLDLAQAVELALDETAA